MTGSDNSHLFARKVDATGRSTGRLANSRVRELNQPPKGEPFAWMTREMLESPGWRAMSKNARMVVDRVAIEHMSHAGTRNGDLPVSFDDLDSYGIRRGSISGAIAEAVALGFTEIAVKGVRAWGPWRGKATRFRLAWLPTSTGDPATARWQRFRSVKDAERAVKQAREAEVRAPKTVQHSDNVVRPVKVAAE